MDLKTAIYRYCNYQERCHQEVKNKLYELKASKTEVDNLIAELIQDNLLNEERFARAYARGKFRIKSWGKRKIVSGLKAKNVSEYCIRKGLEEIDPEEYWQTCQKEAAKAWERYRTVKPEYARVQKSKQLLLAHGYESDLAQDAIKSQQGL